MAQGYKEHIYLHHIIIATMTTTLQARWLSPMRPLSNGPGVQRTDLLTPHNNSSHDVHTPPKGYKEQIYLHHIIIAAMMSTSTILRTHK